MFDGRIIVDQLTKTFRHTSAVDDLSFTVEPGRITGFLGPNGAGKTTTLRMLLGLVTPTAGRATIGGRRYAELADPMKTVGAVFDSSRAHPARRGLANLRIVCAAAGIADQRAAEVLELVGLTGIAEKRVGAYSLGMKQRLGIATAILGDPQVLILDEPANGLDPEGIHWMREFLRTMAVAGRTVLVSSHLLSEMELLVDDVVIIAAGQLVKRGPIGDVVATAGAPIVRVRTPQADEMTAAVIAKGGTVSTRHDGALTVSGLDASAVGGVAFAAGVELHELTPERPDLEGIFLELTQPKAVHQ